MRNVFRAQLERVNATLLGICNEDRDDDADDRMIRGSQWDYPVGGNFGSQDWEKRSS